MRAPRRAAPHRPTPAEGEAAQPWRSVVQRSAEDVNHAGVRVPMVLLRADPLMMPRLRVDKGAIKFVFQAQTPPSNAALVLVQDRSVEHRKSSAHHAQLSLPLRNRAHCGQRLSRGSNRPVRLRLVTREGLYAAGHTAGAARSVCLFRLQGANIMCPGLTSPGATIYDEVPEDTPVVRAPHGCCQSATAAALLKAPTNKLNFYFLN